jgi:hypothetical protein
LAAGLFGKAVITPAQRTQVWTLPYAAVLDGDRDQAFVFATIDGHEALKVPVRVLSLDKDSVLVSAGLEAFSQIIVSGSAYLNDHSVIQVIRK